MAADAGIQVRTLNNTAEIINTSVHGATTLSSQWGLHTVLIILAVVIIAFITVIYMWKVRPIIEKRKLFELKRDSPIPTDMGRQHESDSKEELSKSGKQFLTQLVANMSALTEQVGDISNLRDRVSELERRVSDIDRACSIHTAGNAAVAEALQNIKTKLGEVSAQIEKLDTRIFNLKGHNS